MAGVYGLLSEQVSAVRVVRSFAQEEAELAEFDGRLDEHRAACWASMRAGNCKARRRRRSAAWGRCAWSPSGPRWSAGAS